MKRSLLASVVVVVVIAAVGILLVVRTVMHRPAESEPVSQLTIELDEELIGAHLGEAIRFRTVSHQNSDAFEADVFEDFIAWVAETYPEVNESMSLTRLGRYTLLYRWSGKDPDLDPILLTGHYDVVPVLPGTEELWRHPPFGGRIVDGVIWGRGALDDKSAVVAQLEAATLLLKEGHRPTRSVYFSFGHDEELGGFAGAAAVAEHLKNERIRLLWSLDEGSFLFDGMFPGVEQRLASINIAEKGSMSLEIVARAAGGHSSMPPRRTAIGYLAEAITRLEANPVPGGLSGLSEQMFDTIGRTLPFGPRIFFANRWLFGELLEDQLSALAFGNAMLRSTTAATMLSASVKVNVLPIEAIATVNFRLHPRDSIEDVVDHVKSIVENDRVEVRLRREGARLASPVSDWQSPGYEIIERAIREIHGEVVVMPGLMIAGSDSRHYGRVAENAFRFNPMTVSPEDLTGFHGTNEKIGIHNLAQGTRTYSQIIRLGSSR